MPGSDPLFVQRAAGAVLRGLRRPGTAPEKLASAPRGETLRPALAIEAMLAAMCARFELAQAEGARFLLPALADWRDAVGCADPLLLAANAQGPDGEPLVPLPLPSWCAWLVDAGVLRLHGQPVVDGPRIVQQAWLVVVREAELSALEGFPIVCAGRFAPGAASVELHLALSPPFLAGTWRGSVCLRAAAHRPERVQERIPLWLGPPAMPGSTTAAGAAGEAVVTWAIDPGIGRPSPGTSPAWPTGWPRWAVLRVLEGREPQALWDLTALWRARAGAEAEPASAGMSPGPAVTLRLAVDLGSTATVVVEEDSAASGSVGAKLLHQPRGAAAPAPSSGFRRLAGEARSAHLYGCGETLLARGAQLPSMLTAPGPRAISELLLAPRGALAPEQLWLPQAPQDGEAAGLEGSSLLVDRFKSPELLLLSDWLAHVPGDCPDPALVSRALLDSYAYLLGRALAAAHAAPLVTPEGGRWTQRWPRLGKAEAILTYPQSAWSTSDSVPFSRVFDGAGSELCRGLLAAWPSADRRLVPDPSAAKAARTKPHDARHPIEAFVDFGGLTLQVTVRVPHAAMRPAPFIAGSSMSYLLGGERLIDAAAFASADLDARGDLRQAFRSTARRWRSMIAGGGMLGSAESAVAGSLRAAILGKIFALVQRQLEGTLRRAAPGLVALRGAGVRLYLLGQGWKLLALDAPDERREEETLRRVHEWLLLAPLLRDVPLHLERMTKRRLCEGALSVPPAGGEAEEAVELHGVDVGSSEGLRRRWFGVAEMDGTAEPFVAPLADDPWWRAFAGDEGNGDSLLRVEQWFSGPLHASPFGARLAGGKLAFDSRRSILKQWLDVSGPSLMALHIHGALGSRR